jgi:hypothetical protein
VSNDILLAADAAELLGISCYTLGEYRRRGKITATGRAPGRGQNYLYLRTDLEAFKEQWRQSMLPIDMQAKIEAGERGPDFLRAGLNAALARSGLTLVAAAEASGIPTPTIYSWLLGNKHPYRDSLERLAAAVGAPELVNFIDSRHRRIQVTCRECETVRKRLPSEVRSHTLIVSPERLIVDWDRGTAVHTCRRCANRENVATINQKIIKRKGRKGLRDNARGLLAWQKNNPEQHRRHARAAQAIQVQRGWSERQRLHHRLSHFHLDLNGTLALCSVCHRLLYEPRSQARIAEAQGSQIFGKFHGPCLHKWRKSPACRAWASAAVEARRAGRPVAPFPLPLRPQRRPVDAKALTDGYETTLRYFWLREGSSRADRDDAGELRSITWLLSDLGLTRQGLHQRVDRFLSLLPNERAATGIVRNWCEVLSSLHSADDGG